MKITYTLDVDFVDGQESEYAMIGRKEKLGLIRQDAYVIITVGGHEYSVEWDEICKAIQEMGQKE